MDEQKADDQSKLQSEENVQIDKIVDDDGELLPLDRPGPRDIEQTRMENETLQALPLERSSEMLVNKDDDTVTSGGSSRSRESEGVEDCQGEGSCASEKQNSSDVRIVEETVNTEERMMNVAEEELMLTNSVLRDDSVVEFSLEYIPDSDTRGMENNLQQTEVDSVYCSSTEPDSSRHSRTCAVTQSNQVLTLPSHPVPEDPKTSSCLLTEIESLLTTAVNECSPDSDFEISKVDFSSTPKENLMRMLSCLLDECDTLKREKARLEGEVDRLEADHSSQVYASQIEALEKTLAQAQADACSWQQKLHQAEESYMSENVKIRSDLTTRLERMTREYEAANKDKESMVVKYATSEREVIVAKKQKEAVEKKMKEMEREREQLIAKTKMLISERARICQTLDTKIQKNNWYQREVERLKEEVNSRDIKIKWAQNKLKTELDARQEAQGKLDRALVKIMKHEDELKAIKEEAESIVRSTRDSENSRANVLDMQLKEEKARLIMERQASESRGSAYNKVSTELEALKLKHTALVEETNSLRTRVTTYEAEREETEKLFSSLRTEVTSSRQEAADLNLQLSNTAHLQQQLSREREQLAAANQDIDGLQSTNSELESELLTCRQKEAELLAFTQKLTDKNVQIQSQFSALQSKTQMMELEHGEIKSELDELKMQKSKLKTDLTRENQTHSAQLENLTQQLTEKTEEAKLLTTKVMDLENEIQVLKRKHNNSLKKVMYIPQDIMR
ncbi:coiled-coil domain-containing protein 186-like, partial [Homarus americanus]|uniref:coiled-coil domain-containing protein 186-like n=1 Tax=Homarus americanus TaxID=6706 RepID=UPI001C465C9F